MGARCSVCCACAISYALERLGGQFCQGHWKHFSILGRYTCLTGSTGRVWVKQVLRVQAPRTQCGLLHGSLSQSVAREGLLHWSLWMTRLPLLPEWLSSPLLHRLLLSSDPFGDRSASPAPHPQRLTPSFPPWVRSLLSPAPPCALERGLLFVFFASPSVTRGSDALRSGETGRWASQRQGFLLRGAGPPRALPKAHAHRRSTSRGLLLLPFQRQEGRTRGGMGLLWERRLSQKNTGGRQGGSSL